MRKFMIKNFALDYICKVFNYTFNFTRGAVFLFPAFLLSGIYVVLISDWPEISIYDAVILVLLGILVFLAFFYFRFKPVKVEELADLEQVYMYEQAVLQNIIKDDDLNESKMELFMRANRYVKENIEDKRFYKPWRVIMHPVVIVTISLLLALFINNLFLQ